MDKIKRSRKTIGKRWIYLLIELASIVVFTIPILILMNEMSVDWAEANKSTVTNGEILRYAGMMFVGLWRDPHPERGGSDADLQHHRPPRRNPYPHRGLFEQVSVDGAAENCRGK